MVGPLIKIFITLITLLTRILGDNNKFCLSYDQELNKCISCDNNYNLNNQNLC